MRIGRKGNEMTEDKDKTHCPKCGECLEFESDVCPEVWSHCVRKCGHTGKSCQKINALHI